LAQQDDYYYEIQLSNKQLVFYFLAGATGLILSFLAGVMVGRGVDNGGSVQAQSPKPVQEERVVAEEPVKPSAPPAEELTYAQRLDSEKSDDSLEKTKPAKPAADGAAKGAKAEPPKPDAAKDKSAKADAPKADKAPDKPAAKASAPSKSPQPRPSAAAAAKPGAGTFSIQVGAFRDKDTADSVVANLKKKNYAAVAVAPEGADGLFIVRVGSYTARADAERVQTKLHDEEKYKPFIVKN
jgi:cell division septation protein DedD